jgi:O-antigen chain-terminating methyltransferase
MNNLQQEAIEELRQKLHNKETASEPASLPPGQSATDPYCLADLLRLPLEQFVETAYRVILRREVDPPSRIYHIMAVGSATLSRIELLDALCNSQEGQNQGVVVDGLRQMMRRQRFIYSLPLVGRLLRLFRRVTATPPTPQIFAEFVKSQQDLAECITALQLQIQIQSAKYHDVVVRLENLETDVSDIRLETRRVVAEYRRYLLDLEPGAVVPSTPTKVECAMPSVFVNSIYASFEDEFRGSPSQVRQGLSPYLPLVRETVLQHPGLPVIDLGCGRGEWLELLTGERIQVKGADLNPTVVAPLVQQGLDVAQADIFTYLSDLPDASAAVVTSFHLIEHLPPEQWIPLLDQIRRVLAPSGLAIIETPNPRNILVGSGDFYRDPSHHTPVFPDTLSFLGRIRGFDDSVAWYFADDRSRLVPAESWHFDTIDDYVRISRDYAWTGRKNI